jgi:hypothetical protein
MNTGNKLNRIFRTYDRNFDIRSSALERNFDSILGVGVGDCMKNIQCNGKIAL